MARGNLRDTQIRAALETVAVELAVVRNAYPLVRLRMVQAVERSGLGALLVPAIDDLDGVDHAAEAAQDHVCLALRSLLDA